MEPTIKKPPKLYLKPKESLTAASRLAFSPDTSIPTVSMFLNYSYF